MKKRLSVYSKILVLDLCFLILFWITSIWSVTVEAVLNAIGFIARMLPRTETILITETLRFAVAFIVIFLLTTLATGILNKKLNLLSTKAFLLTQVVFLIFVIVLVVYALSLFTIGM